MNLAYHTDGVGRVIRAEVMLTLEDGVRSEHNQRMAGEGDGRLSTDGGGHLFGRQFGGPKDAFNHVAMDADLNGNHKALGKWGQMEQKWAKLLEKDPQTKIHVSVEPIYTNNTARPDSFKVTQTINGKPTVTKMQNKPGG